MKIVVAGGTGFLGRAVCKRLSVQGNNVVVLSRTPEERRSVSTEHLVEFAEGLDAVDGAEVVINLAGEGIADRPWSERRRKVLVDSRVRTTASLVDAIAAAKHKPRLLINASAVGYYGDTGEAEVSESAEPGDGFLADLCKRWEEAAVKAEEHGVNVVRLRIGIVLGEGGALARMLLPFKMFLGGPLGSGQQWMSWIHVDDLTGLIAFLIEKEGGSEAINAVAPEPVRNREFSRLLGKALGRPSWLPAPAFALRLALGKMSEMVLTGQKVLPRRAQLLGYEFRFNKLDKALEDTLVHRGPA